MTNETHTCLVCQRSSREIPLLAVESKSQTYWICPQDLPILIHNPQKLADRLPGAENLQGHEH
ncbi:MAG TPA: hypothetical protein VF813_09925 [Anaerolineaceae bacterium]